MMSPKNTHMSVFSFVICQELRVINDSTFDKIVVLPYTFIVGKFLIFNFHFILENMDIIWCKQQLYHLYTLQPALKDKFSDFTRQARWEYKADCLEKFGSVTNVHTFLLTPGEFAIQQEGEHWVADYSWTVQTISWEQLSGSLISNSFIENTSFSWMMDHIKNIWRILLLVIIGICLWKIVRYFLVTMYDVFNVWRMEYARVTLPRGDSKNDREREKEVAKDMKEKIGRMSQVFSSLHRLGDLSSADIILRYLFNKPKMVFMVHYEDALVSFIIGTYPEYRKIVEWAIAAQYADASIEVIEAPKLFKKKYTDIMPLLPTKSPYYPIRLFKQLEDDPMNNILDSIGKVPREDSFSVVILMRPERETFNEWAQKLANALFKKDKAVTDPKPLWQKLLPWNLFSFFINWPSQKLIESFNPSKQQWDPMVRMVKAEEEAYNFMAEEAAKPAYEAWLLLISWSDVEGREKESIYNVFSAYSIYKDEYNNSLDNSSMITDMPGISVIVSTFWKFSIDFLLLGLFYKKNIFTVGELSSLFHFPDGMFNRSPAIKWMDYKVVAWPDTLPVATEPTPYVMTGVIADPFKKWDLDKILRTMKHQNIVMKEIEEEKKEELAKDYVAKEGEEIVVEWEKSYRVTKVKKKVAGLQVCNDAILLGLNVYRNRYVPVYMKRKDRTRHHYIIWKSGTGKSVFISAMARQDIRTGDGLCVIDPHGDLVEDILQYVPKERARDVVYFDAGNEARPMWLNLYEIHDAASADRAVNDATEMFIKMFGAEIFGPRIQEYFKFGSLTLLQDMEDPSTLLDVPRLFTDEVYREYKQKKITSPILKNRRDKTYNSMGDREKQEIIPYFTSKFVSFNTNSLIRNIIGQSKSAFDFEEVMNNQKILLINLSKGKIGELNAQLLGMILVSKIYNGAMARARMAEKDRKYFFLYVDEFQNFVTDTFADILSEARKYKLALIMAHQFISQLDSNAWNNIWEWKSKVKDAVFGNVGTMMSFKVGAPDAEFLEKEYTPVLGAQDILGIANYKAYVKLNINNTTSRAFSMNTIWTEDYKNPKMADVLRQYCEKKYGRKKEFVDAEITARLGMAEETPALESWVSEWVLAWWTQTEVAQEQSQQTPWTQDSTSTGV